MKPLKIAAVGLVVLLAVASLVLAFGIPAGFLAKLASGFGRGKSFGLGLMLLRRQPS